MRAGAVRRARRRPLHINAPRAAEARHLLRRTAQLRPKPRLIEDPPAGLRRCLAAERKEIGKHDTLLPLYRMRRPRDPPRFGRIIFIQKRFINILDISLSRCIMKPVMREAAADRSRARIRAGTGRLKGEACRRAACRSRSAGIWDAGRRSCGLSRGLPRGELSCANTRFDVRHDGRS